MQDLAIIKDTLVERLEGKPLTEDKDTWNCLLRSIPKSRYVPLQYKPDFLRYQTAYFSDVYDAFLDMSMVLYRGGKPVGLWPICAFVDHGMLKLGTAGGALLEPLFCDLPKAEAQRRVISNCIDALREHGTILSAVTLTDFGIGQWGRKLLEQGAVSEKVTWHAFTDLFLPNKEIQYRTRRTNRYSVEKGKEDYNIDIVDCRSDTIPESFVKLHELHRTVAGRETRSQKTWDIQQEIVLDASGESGKSFIVFISDRHTNVLVGGGTL